MFHVNRNRPAVHVRNGINLRLEEKSDWQTGPVPAYSVSRPEILTLIFCFYLLFQLFEFLAKLRDHVFLLVELDFHFPVLLACLD